MKLMAKRYLWILLIPIFIGILIEGGRITNTLYEISQLKILTPRAKKEGKEVSGPRYALERYEVISSKAIFASRRLKEKRTGGRAKQTKATSSQVPFKLKGTAVINPGNSLAIIEDPSTRRHLIYREGDVVKGFKIVKIMEGKIVVDKDGREEIVEVVKERGPERVIKVKRRPVPKRKKPRAF